MTDHDMTDRDAHDVARRVREELARRRVSRQALADMAKISLSTLEKALAGARPFTLATIIRLEQALGTALRPSTAPVLPDAAPEAMGAYAHAAVRWIEGSYLTLRPSFGVPGGVFGYVTTIRWNDAAGHLDFAESERADAQFAQSGHVSMPNLSGHIYLVTNSAGQYRTLVLARPTAAGILYGILTSLQAERGSQLVPIACPVALVPAARVADPQTGLIAPGSPNHGRYRALLDAAICDDFVRFHA